MDGVDDADQRRAGLFKKSEGLVQERGRRVIPNRDRRNCVDSSHCTRCDNPGHFSLDDLGTGRIFTEGLLEQVGGGIQPSDRVLRDKKHLRVIETTRYRNDGIRLDYAATMGAASIDQITFLV